MKLVNVNDFVFKAMADIWKRFSMPALGYPWACFALLGDKSVETFKDKWCHIQQTHAKCKQCLDLEFTGILLRRFEAPSPNDDQAWAVTQSKVTTILEQVATYSPLNSESVENAHAVAQTLLSKVRGQLKSLSTAVEDSLLDSITRAYAKLRKQVKAEESPKNILPALSRLGSRTRGAYSKPKGVFQQGHRKPLEVRVRTAQNKKLRRMSGWGVFCRQNLQKKQLSPGSYGNTIKALGQQWKSMSKKDRSDFQVLAEAENSTRAELLNTPLPTASGQHCTEEQSRAEASKSLRKFLIKVKPKRAMLNDANYQRSPAWSAHGLGVADANSALKLDLFDEVSDVSFPSQILKDHLHSPLPAVSNSELDNDIHNQSCGVQFGQCRSSFKSGLRNLCQLRLSEHLITNSITIGTLMTLQVGNETFNCLSSPVTVLLGVVYRKPALIVFLKLYSVATEKYSLLGPFADPSFISAEHLLDDLLQEVVSPYFISVVCRPPPDCYQPSSFCVTLRSNELIQYAAVCLKYAIIRCDFISWFYAVYL